MDTNFGRHFLFILRRLHISPLLYTCWLCFAFSSRYIVCDYKTVPLHTRQVIVFVILLAAPVTCLIEVFCTL